MDYKQILTNAFGDIILEAKMIQNDFGPTLEVTVNHTNLKDVEMLSKKISLFLESQKWFTDNHYLEVLSKGFDTNVDINQLDKFINKDVTLKLKKSYLGQDIFVVKILEDRLDSFIASWNKKGQLKKIEFEKKDILNAELYIKY
ncbi:ribosome assembly cofactor RimP [Mycoplasma sp. CSL10137]|uniref:ribosome assembly cofactor RimP n=1 Tax=unclassified Mycoplasma TaxID=2683645 RepID=UPI00197BFB8F|nr:MULTISPECIES: ribosome assembly cofactor RimP [unclassified Mycoplasma]MBN4083413.1 ribosome assembly cofactor RimP [Mycoplasma sp. CSL10137]MBN4084284.1 ribosome assembly cofactor RimP [Mycoplasma sp. CSL10166]